VDWNLVVLRLLVADRDCGARYASRERLRKRRAHHDYDWEDVSDTRNTFKGHCTMNS